MIPKCNVVNYRHIDNGWDIQQTDVYYEYQKKVVMTGAAQQIDLMIHFPVKLERIEYFFNDLTSRVFATQIFDGNVDENAYALIVDWNTTMDQSILVLCNQDNLKFTQPPIRIRTDITASTAGKTITIKIYVKKLDEIPIIWSD